MWLIFLPDFSKWNAYLSPGDCTLGKGNNQNFQRPSISGFELTLIPGKPKCHSDSPTKVGLIEIRQSTEFQPGPSFWDVDNDLAE